MDEAKRQKLRFLYGIFLGVFTVAIGVTLISLAMQIYFSDPQGNPYNAADVASKARGMIAPVVLWIAAAIVGFVLSEVFPVAERRPAQDGLTSYKKLRRRVPAGEGEEFNRVWTEFRSREVTRLVVRLICVGAALSSGITIVVYLADGSHFPALDPGGEIIDMLRYVLPLVGVAFAFLIGATVYEGVCAKRELATVKQLIVLGKGYPVRRGKLSAVQDGAAAIWNSDILVWTVRSVLLTLAVSFLIAGIVNGGMSDVLGKAIQICKECIGMG